jgi:hypothetical protein
LIRPSKRLDAYKKDLHLLLSKASLNQQTFIQRSTDNLRASNERLGMESDKMLARVQFLKEDLLEALQSFQSGVIDPIASGIMRDKLGALDAKGQEIVKAADMFRALRFSGMTVRHCNVVERHGLHSIRSLIELTAD